MSDNTDGRNLGGAFITSREIYDAVLKLTAKVDVLIEQHSTVSDDVEDHEGRIRSLEKTRWPLPSVSVLVSVAALGLALFTKLA